jgi:type II secretory pathway predicted ATPase ExeA
MHVQGRLSSPLLVLDLGLDIIDSIRRFYLKGDSFSGKTTMRRLISLEMSPKPVRTF